MKMKGKIVLINIVSLVIALMISSFMFFLYILYFFDPSIHEYYTSRHQLYDKFRSIKDISQLEELENLSIDPLAVFLVIDVIEGELVFARPRHRFSDKQKVQNWTPSSFVERLSRDWKDFTQDFYSESITNKEAELVLFYFSIRSVDHPSRPFSPPPFGWVFLLFGTAIISASIISSIVLQRTNRNVSQLEMATRRIADGDLDFSLTLDGGDEIAGLANSFNAMRLSLKEGQAIRNRFLMGVSHDLKTPLTTIEGYLEAIKDGVVSNDEVPIVMERIRRKSHLLETRILELIDYAKMETGEWTLAFEDISLNTIFTDLEEFYSDEVRVANRFFSVKNLITEDIRVKLDSGLFIRLIENLVNNAIKYSNELSEISIKIEKTEDMVGDGASFVIISIENEGDSISLEEKELLFEPFYRVNPSRNTPGFGLGLSIVKSIVDAHGWKIEVVSDSESRICFRVLIPLQSD